MFIEESNVFMILLEKATNWKIETCQHFSSGAEFRILQLHQQLILLLLNKN